MSRQVRDEYMQAVQGGAKHPLYKGLLALAHEEWGAEWGMEASITYFPSEANGWTAYASATVTTPSGQKFTEAADANAENTNRQIAKHVPRMALTRAKGRALKDALGIGDATAEEMGGEDAPSRQQAPSPTQRTGQGSSGAQTANTSVERTPGGASVKAARKLWVVAGGREGADAFQKQHGDIQQMDARTVSEHIDKLTKEGA